MKMYRIGWKLSKRGRDFPIGEVVSKEELLTYWSAPQIAGFRASGALRVVNIAADPEALAKSAELLHSMNVTEAKEHIAGLTDQVELARLHAAEKEHPRYPDGRTGVLDAIEERLGEVGHPAVDPKGDDGEP